MPPKFQQVILPISVILLCCPIIVSAQQSQESYWSFLDDPAYTVTIENGLPINAISSLVFDRSGFAWIGTPEGLARWDGLKAITYQHDPEDSTSISGHVIRPNGLKYDSVNDKILIGTENGLSILDPRTNQFINYIHNKQNKQSLQGSVLSVFLDMENEVWLGTTEGLAKKNRQEEGFLNFSIPSFLIDTLNLSLERLNAIFDIVQDKRDPQILWLATLEGLVKFNSLEGSFQLFRASGKRDLRRSNEMTRFALHTNGNLYIGTWNYDLSVFSTVTRRFVTHMGPGALQDSLRFDETVVPFFEKSGRELWVGSVKGLGILNTETSRIEFIKTFRNSAGQRYYPHFLSIHQNNHWWIGSDYGLQYFNERPPPIRNFFFDPKDESHMYLPNTLFESQASNRLYIGYAGGEGLHYFDLNKHSFHILRYAHRGIREKTILKILPGVDHGTLFFLTKNELYHLNERNHEITQLNLPYDNTTENTDILNQGTQNFWISGREKGVRKYNLTSGTFTDPVNWKDYFKNLDNDRPNIIFIAEDGSGRIYFSRYAKSYGYFEPETTRLHYFDHSDQAFGIASFYFSDDTLWAATNDHGLGYFAPNDPKAGLIIKYDMGNVLMSNFIQSIERDRNGKFWLLTELGLEYIISDIKKSIHVDEYYGLKQFDAMANRVAFWPGKLFQLSDGRMIVGYRRGIGIFHPDSIEYEKMTIMPYLSEVRIFNKILPLDSISRERKIIELKHNQNYMTLDYSALSLYRGKSIRWLHKLEGIDLDWVESKEQSASYSKISPGEYRFIIRLEQSSGYRSSSELVYTIRIAHPWWNNPYAWGVYLLIAFGIGWNFYRFQMRKKLIIKDAESAKELEQLKNRLYANITHEFRTPLTVILGMADQIKNDPQKWIDNGLKMIKRNGRKLLNLTNQMLELSKLEANALPVNMIQGDITIYLKYLVESFHSLAGMKNIRLEFSAEPEKIIMDFDPDKIQDILSNLLSNAIKFTSESGGVRILAAEKWIRNQKYLELKVADMGEGIPAEHLPKVFDRYFQAEHHQGHSNEGTGLGLALTKELVKLLKGDISVQSTFGKGSTFTVQLPLTNNKAFSSQEKVLHEHIAEKKEERLAPPGENKSEKLLLLIVEDNADVMQYLHGLLSDKYQIIGAENGSKGFEKAINTIPDLVISDVMMPVMDGFEFCRRMKSDLRTSHIPVVLLTARADAESKIGGLEAGADAYLSKPFNREELFVRIVKLIELRKTLRSRYKEDILLGESDVTVKDAHFEKEDAFLQEVCQLLEDHLDDEEFGVAELCRSLGMSRSQLYRKFKALTNITVNHFIHKLRLTKAKKLLLTTNLNVSEVAFETGFKNLSHFSRLFSEEFGVAPSRIRKR